MERMDAVAKLAGGSQDKVTNKEQNTSHNQPSAVHIDVPAMPSLQP